MKSLSRVWLFQTPWTVARRASPSMGFSRQEYWSGLPFPSPGDLPDPGIKTWVSCMKADSLLSEPPGDPLKKKNFFLKRERFKSAKLKKNFVVVALYPVNQWVQALIKIIQFDQWDAVYLECPLCSRLWLAVKGLTNDAAERCLAGSPRTVGEIVSYKPGEQRVLCDRL